MTPSFRTTDLAVGYTARRSRIVVLEKLNLSIRPGDLVCLLGPNGVGKSTLLRTLAGIQPPLSGSIEIDGVDLRRMRPLELARHIGVVLTDRPLIGSLRAYKLVELGRYPHLNWLGQLAPRDHEVVEWAIRSVSAERLAGRDTDKLSDGERQRFMIARALAQEPSILLLDEPTAFLDVAARAELMGLLRHLAREERIAIVVSTHDLELALRMADCLWLVGPDSTLHSGVPEDLIVAGSIAQAFPAASIHFDAENRVFRPTTEHRGFAVVEGSRLHAQLAATVLERAGFHAGGHSGSAVRVSIDAASHWESVRGEDRECGDGFAALAEWARRLPGEMPGSGATH